MCQHLHVLPQTGALLDQDSLFIAVMDIVVSAQETKQELDRKQAEASSRSKT